MGIRTSHITPKACAVTAIIETEGSKSLGVAVTPNFTQLECAKTATLMITIARKGKNSAKFKERRTMSQA